MFTVVPSYNGNFSQIVSFVMTVYHCGINAADNSIFKCGTVDPI